jgi:hypothetical protein
MPGISRFIDRPNTWRCRAFRSTAQRLPIGWARPAELTPVYERMKEMLLVSAVIVVEPGSNQVGILLDHPWDERPWAGPDPPVVAYTYVHLRARARR